MSEGLYIWQGGQRIEIEKSAEHVAIQSISPDAAFESARRLGVGVKEVAPATAGTMKMQIEGDRDAAMDTLRNEHVVHHLYNIAGNPNDEIVISDSYYLRFSPQTTDGTIKDTIEAEKLEIIDQISAKTYLVRVTAATGVNPIKSANRLAEHAAVEFAEQNLVHSLQTFSGVPDDDLFSKQWHLNTESDGEDRVRGCDIDVLGAWRITRGSRDIVVCVADDGFDFEHPDFRGADKIAGKINIRLKGPFGIETDENVHPRRGNRHGTPCAGLAIAEINSQGTVGVAPGCAFLPVRFPRSLKDNQIISMFDIISPHADVLSCSWGVQPSDRPMSIPLSEKISELFLSGGRRGKGLIVSVAAGNYNCPTRDLQNARIYKYFDGFNVLRSHTGRINRWVAVHPNVLTVSASTSLKTRSAYSSWGKEVNLCAPSNNFDDLKRFSPRGLKIVTTDNEELGADTDLTTGSQYTEAFGGTSAAAPIVAGVCALMLSANPELSARAVMRLIEETADKDLVIESETEVNEPGEYLNGFSLWFGYGKVNAAKAVNAAAATV